MDIASESFGHRLKAERERRGIALKTIAASTKITASLLADLERGDVTKWPHGIFRRAFVREYAASIGLAPESVVAEFVQLFPDERSGDPPSLDQQGSLRLTLADAGRRPLTSMAIQAAAAMSEMCAILTLAATFTWLTGLNFWTACGALSLTYYTAASAFCGRSPALWWLHHGKRGRAAGARRERTSSRSLLDFFAQQAQTDRSDSASAISRGGAAAENLQTASGVILPS